jgi:hypothetical protein
MIAKISQEGNGHQGELDRRRAVLGAREATQQAGRVGLVLTDRSAMEASGSAPGAASGQAV